MRILFLIFLGTSLISCEFNQSASKDFLTGISTVGNGLSCDDVYLTDGENRLDETSFVFGEKLHLNFENIKGFKKEEGFAFPGLQILIIGQKGDTIFAVDDLYEDQTAGYDLSPLLLQANLTVGAPIFSNNKYTIHTNIWDKKGSGTFKAKMDFDVVSNDQIVIESNELVYDEVYLFSEESGLTKTDNKVKLNETVYMVFTGLKGFSDENGYASIGLSLKSTDSEGNIILDEEDLVGESDMSVAEIQDQLAPSFVFTGADIKSPVTCEVVVWDKKSEHRISASLELVIE